MRRTFMLLLLVLVSCGWTHGTCVNGCFTQIKLGAGGFNTGIDIVASGGQRYMVTRVDVYGAYRKYPGDSQWVQLVTANSGLAASTQPGNGVWEIKIAPSDTNTIAMSYYGFTYLSTNAGSLFTKTTLQRDPGAAGGTIYGPNNDPQKFIQNKLAFDPANKSIIYVWQTTSGGLWRSLDGGSSWTNISTSLGITASTTSGGSIIFDASSVSGGQAQIVYVVSNGKGVWQSTNGGTSFTQITDGVTPPGPTIAYTGMVGADGVLWISSAVQNKVTGTIWKFTAATWTASLTSQQASVVVDPGTPGRVLAFGGPNGVQTLDNAATAWSSTYFWNFPTGHGVTQSPSDIAWLAPSMNSNARGCQSSMGMFDPTGTGRLYLSCGLGVFYLVWPTTFTGGDPLISESLGMETWSLGNDAIAPPGDSHVYFALQDRGVMVGNTQTYPSSYAFFLSASGLTEGWSVDYASSNPAACVVTNQQNIAGGETQSGVTINQGTSWSKFTSQSPAATTGGQIAAADCTNFVWAPASGGTRPQYSIDSGANWAIGQVGGVNLPSDGWSFSPFNFQQQVAADRVNIGTFYLYNFVHGFYQSTNKGVDWAIKSAPAGLLGFSPARMRTAPGNALHLWFAAAGQYYDSTLNYSTDGGANWTAIANVDRVWDFGFSATKPGASYPTIWIIGRVGGGTNYGIFYSIDMGTNWVLVTSGTVSTLGSSTLFTSDLHANNLGINNIINGDMNNWNRFFIQSGSSWWQGVVTNYLLNRDLDPAANDNSPAFLNKAA